MTTTPPPFTPPSHTAAPGTKWPKVLGIIAIIFGAGGLLQAVIGPVSMIVVRKQMQAVVEQGADQAKVDEYLSKIASHTYISSAVMAVVGLLLLVGGILLLRRRKVASPVLQTWAVLKLILGGLVTFRSASLSRMQMDIIMSNAALGGGQEAEMMKTFTNYGVWIGLIFGLLWMAVLPIFVLVWFNREKAKQDMSSW